MASILLTDPVLQWLEPADRHRIRALSKEHRDAIDAHTATQTTYTLRMHPDLSWRAREALYSRYPKIQTLTFECGGPDMITTFLRPTLQRIHLRIPLHIEMDPESPGMFHWSDAEEMSFHLRDLQIFLERTPEAQLTRFELTFLPTVRLRFIDDCSRIVEYDRDGPIYEDSDRIIRDTYGSPEIYFSILERCPRMDELGEALKALSQMRPWKSFCLPAEIPGASEIPFATLAKPCETDEESIESLWEHIQILRSRPPTSDW